MPTPFLCPYQLPLQPDTAQSFQDSTPVSRNCCSLVPQTLFGLPSNLINSPSLIWRTKWCETNQWFISFTRLFNQYLLSNKCKQQKTLFLFGNSFYSGPFFYDFPKNILNTGAPRHHFHTVPTAPQVCFTCSGADGITSSPSQQKHLLFATHLPFLWELRHQHLSPFLKCILLPELFVPPV